MTRATAFRLAPLAQRPEHTRSLNDQEAEREPNGENVTTFRVAPLDQGTERGPGQNQGGLPEQLHPLPQIPVQRDEPARSAPAHRGHPVDQGERPRFAAGIHGRDVDRTPPDVHDLPFTEPATQRQRPTLGAVARRLCRVPPPPELSGPQNLCGGERVGVGEQQHTQVPGLADAHDAMPAPPRSPLLAEPLFRNSGERRSGIVEKSCGSVHDSRV